MSRTGDLSSLPSRSLWWVEEDIVNKLLKNGDREAAFTQDTRCGGGTKETILELAERR